MYREKVGWFGILALASVYTCAWPVLLLAQSGGGSGGAGGAAGPGGGGSMGGTSGPGSMGGPAFGRPAVPRGKDPANPLLNPQLPNAQTLQRERAQRLEQQLRQGQTNESTPQTEMSDRLDQLYKNQPSRPSGTLEETR